MLLLTADVCRKLRISETEYHRLEAAAAVGAATAAPDAGVHVGRRAKTTSGAAHGASWTAVGVSLYPLCQSEPAGGSLPSRRGDPFGWHHGERDRGRHGCVVVLGLDKVTCGSVGVTCTMYKVTVHCHTSMVTSRFGVNLKARVQRPIDDVGFCCSHSMLRSLLQRSPGLPLTLGQRYDASSCHR